MLHCKLITHDLKGAVEVPYSTENKNFGTTFQSSTLNLFAEQMVDLMLKHNNSIGSTLGCWIDFSLAILECDTESVLLYLKKPTVTKEALNEIHNFLTNLDENSLISAISNYTIYSFEPYFLEKLIENIRAKSFANAPSRYKSELAFASVKDAKKYMQLTDTFFDPSKLSLIELDTENCIIFEADQNFINQIDSDQSIDVAVNLIRSYWSEQKTSEPISEIILQGVIAVKGGLHIS